MLQQLYADENGINQIALIESDAANVHKEILYYALIRSFGLRQMALSSLSDAYQYAGVVAINPDDSILSLISEGRKILILGQLGTRLRIVLGVDEKATGSKWDGLWDILQSTHHDASRGSIHYSSDNPLTSHLSYRRRDLLRYDFEREWNNLGYGGIVKNDPIWGVSFRAEPSSPVLPIGWLVDQYGEHAGLYAGLIDFSDASILWFNRPVGPVDSLEWSIVEAFFSEYRAGDLACFPYIREIPYGYNGAVCMHADCDEAISSAKKLFELYRHYNIPFSLAIKTEQKITSKDITFAQHVLQAGGSIASHSSNHFERWGGTRQVAYNEAMDSKLWIEQRVTEGKPVRYAVSPFYQNPPFAVQALADAGYMGFIGGIICNDPEYLIGRSGLVPFCDGKIVSHSQQCMLHGDCYHRYGNSIEPYIEAFESHMRARGFFGYLDHPFSKRYSYGWFNEKERLEAHAKLIAHMKDSGRVWFTNLDQCLDFIRKKSSASVWIDNSGTLQGSVFIDRRMPLPDLAVSYRGEITRICNTRKNLLQ